VAKQSYSYYLMVLGGVGWDKKGLLESNLHVYDGDDTKIIVYSMEKWPKGGDRKKSKNLYKNAMNSYSFVQVLDIIT